MKKVAILIFGLFVQGTAIASMPTAPMAKDSVKRQTPRFITVGAGFHYSKFRDFATSPLLYDGIGYVLSIGTSRLNQRRDSEFTFQFITGQHSAIVGNEFAISTFNQPSLTYGYLLSIKKLSTEKWNFKAGGMINATLNIRLNESLFNNAFGIESINTLFASAKVTRDFSRANTTTKKILFLNFKLKPKKRDLSYRLNVGLINNNLRNGYAYLNDSWIISDDSKVLDGYEYSFFSGMRIGSELNYTKYLVNGNAIRLTYISDFYNTGNNDALDRFEASHHVLRFALLFRTK